MDEYENDLDADGERMQEDDPCANEVTEGIFSSNKCDPKKKEAPKTDEKKKGCGCAKPARKSSRKSCGKRGMKLSQLPRSYNPFIVFYLKMYYENPSKKITEVARAAAKVWCRMSDKDKEAYIKIARQESARRAKSCKKPKKKKC